MVCKRLEELGIIPEEEQSMNFAFYYTLLFIININS